MPSSVGSVKKKTNLVSVLLVIDDSQLVTENLCTYNFNKCDEGESDVTADTICKRTNWRYKKILFNESMQRRQ